MKSFFIGLTLPQNAWMWDAIQASLVAVGFGLVIIQLRHSHGQNSISHLNYFRSLWESDSLLRARHAIVSNTDLSESDLQACEDIVATFMEDLGAVMSVRQANADHVWSYFSYYVDGYWILLNPKIRFYREKTLDRTYFEHFEDLYNLCAKVSKRHGGFSMPESFSSAFRKEEECVLKFLLKTDE